MMISPLDAYSAAKHGETGFVGWSYYQETSIGFGLENGVILVWQSENPDDTIRLEPNNPEDYLDALDDWIDGG